MVSIDFTASNGDPAFGNSLHANNPYSFLLNVSIVRITTCTVSYSQNEYQKAIISTANVLLEYDSDKMIAAYGCTYEATVFYWFDLLLKKFAIFWWFLTVFLCLLDGAKIPPDFKTNHCFPLAYSHSQVPAVPGLMAACKINCFAIACRWYLSVVITYCLIRCQCFEYTEAVRTDQHGAHHCGSDAFVARVAWRVRGVSHRHRRRDQVKTTGFWGVGALGAHENDCRASFLDVFEAFLIACSDQDKTVEQLVLASRMPISIVIVGVGSADFTQVRWIEFFEFFKFFELDGISRFWR